MKRAYFVTKVRWSAALPSGRPDSAIILAECADDIARILENEHGGIVDSLEAEPLKQGKGFDALIEGIRGVGQGIGRRIVVNRRRVVSERRARYAPVAEAADVRIEFPARGATYNRDEYGVYEYGEYPDSSVLAGQERRCFLDSFATLAEAQAAYPHAVVTEGCGFRPPSLDHLPEDGDPGTVGESKPPRYRYQSQTGHPMTLATLEKYVRIALRVDSVPPNTPLLFEFDEAKVHDDFPGGTALLTDVRYETDGRSVSQPFIIFRAEPADRAYATEAEAWAAEEARKPLGAGITAEGLAEAALNAACREVQDILGVEDGDIAGAFFDGGEAGALIRGLLTTYARMELAFLNRDEPNADAVREGKPTPYSALTIARASQLDAATWEVAKLVATVAATLRAAEICAEIPKHVNDTIEMAVLIVNRSAQAVSGDRVREAAPRPYLSGENLGRKCLECGAIEGKDPHSGDCPNRAKPSMLDGIERMEAYEHALAKIVEGVTIFVAAGGRIGLKSDDPAHRELTGLILAFGETAKAALRHRVRERPTDVYSINRACDRGEITGEERDYLVDRAAREAAQNAANLRPLGPRIMLAIGTWVKRDDHRRDAATGHHAECVSMGDGLWSCGATDTKPRCRHSHQLVREGQPPVYDAGSRRANFSILYNGHDAMVIRDLGPWDKHLSVTNDAEGVVSRLAAHLSGRPLYYVDSLGELDQLRVKNGAFTGLAPADTGMRERLLKHPEVARHVGVQGKVSERTPPKYVVGQEVDYYYTRGGGGGSGHRANEKVRLDAIIHKVGKKAVQIRTIDEDSEMDRPRWVRRASLRLKPHAEALSEIVRRVNAFDRQTASARHTDTGEAWRHFYYIRGVAKKALQVREVGPDDNKTDCSAGCGQKLDDQVMIDCPDCELPFCPACYPEHDCEPAIEGRKVALLLRPGRTRFTRIGIRDYKDITKAVGDTFCQAFGWPGGPMAYCDDNGLYKPELGVSAVVGLSLRAEPWAIKGPLLITGCTRSGDSRSLTALEIESFRLSAPLTGEVPSGEGFGGPWQPFRFKAPMIDYRHPAKRSPQ